MGTPVPADAIVHGVQSIAERVQWVLDHRGLSARKWSADAELSPAYVRKLIERDAKRPDAEAIERLAKVAGVPPRWLLHGEGSPPDFPPLKLPDPTIVRDPTTYALDERESRLAAILFDLIRLPEHKDFTEDDYKAVRQVIAETFPFETTDGDPAERLRQRLVAARQLRREGLPVNTTSILTRAQAGKTQHAQARAAEVEDRELAEARAEMEAAGLTPNTEVGEILAAKKKRKAARE